jgi:hypothetical protein
LMDLLRSRAFSLVRIRFSCDLMLATRLPSISLSGRGAVVRHSRRILTAWYDRSEETPPEETPDESQQDRSMEVGAWRY